MFGFKKNPPEPPKSVDPVKRLQDATDEFNAAMEALPPGTKLSPFVQRRSGMRSLLTLSSWAPDAFKTVWPPENFR